MQENCQNKENKEIIGEILEYWRTIAVLGQDSFPSGRDNEKRIKDHKKKLKKGEPSNLEWLQQFQGFRAEEILAKTILSEVRREADECKMNCWGNISVYLGAVSREACVNALISRLGLEAQEDMRPEKQTDYIGIVSFQLDATGTYIENSLSLSPVLWAISQLPKQPAQGKENANGNYLGADFYRSANDILNADHFNSNEMGKPYYVSGQDIKALYLELKTKYVAPVLRPDGQKDDVRECYAIQYRLFCNESEKEKQGDESSFRLSKDYFSRDLEMLSKVNMQEGLSKTMQDYILSLHRRKLQNENREKVDMRVDIIRNMKENVSFIDQLFDIRNAPLGKWPSQYMPAFMQQVAINLFVGEKSPLQDLALPIFSVNGPPGTGKTTLLKEIVVDHIVERAILLAEYDKPDDAFIAHRFEGGKQEDNSYIAPATRWHELKNDRINNYGILVASCNNAAVENISKELPIGTGILSALTPGEHAPEVIKKGLTEVRTLFDVNRSKDMEKVRGGKRREGRRSPDIYFTEYANWLFYGGEAWGLIAAPLGKKSNRMRFYDYVLHNLIEDFYKDSPDRWRDDADVHSRVIKYQVAREKFLLQLDRVKEIQTKLAEDREKIRKINVVSKCEEAIAQRQAQIKIKDKEKIQAEGELSIIQEDLNASGQRLEQIIAESNEWALKLQMLRDEKESLENARIEEDNKMNYIQKMPSVWSKMFKTKKYRESLELVLVCQSKITELLTKISEKETEVQEIEAEFELKRKKCATQQEQKNMLQQQYHTCQTRIYALEGEIERLETESSGLLEEIRKIEGEYNEALSNFQNSAPDCIGGILNSEYINELADPDEEKSTKAHVGNPWLTQQYNREREKLFYYAVKMNKEFVLASTACRDNLLTLCVYWGYIKDNDGNRIQFSEKDEGGCVLALFQTLFLLVPVISSTFASIASLFKNVHQKNGLGLLIVDEAGQAQPQMALGALYRARRALIVGDPKQITPVVTDDLKHLKDSYTGEVYQPYKEKDISVQVCADFLNPFGTYMGKEDVFSEWVGCPLLVHRRCISPMYKISNELSYGGMMKQQTQAPKPEVAAKFLFESSRWIQVSGQENGQKDHFVKPQGKIVCELLENAFAKEEEPDIFIISPFSTVVKGVKDYIRSYSKDDKKIYAQYAKWSEAHIGTVHSFQGKEAKEVIFLLGCDGSKSASGAIRWVTKNIINVAVTRAKYRLYVVGDKVAWKQSEHMQLVMRILEEESSK